MFSPPAVDTILAALKRFVPAEHESDLRQHLDGLHPHVGSHCAQDRLADEDGVRPLSEKGEQASSVAYLFPILRLDLAPGNEELANELCIYVFKAV